MIVTYKGLDFVCCILCAKCCNCVVLRLCGELGDVSVAISFPAGDYAEAFDFDCDGVYGECNRWDRQVGLDVLHCPWFVVLGYSVFLDCGVWKR